MKGGRSSQHTQPVAAQATPGIGAGLAAGTAAGPTGQLPSHLRLLVDPGVQRLDGTGDRTVLLGGSPLRLMRLDARAMAVFDQLATGVVLGDVTGASKRAVAGLARRLLNGGMAQPDWSASVPADPQTRRYTAADVTVVVPVKDRPEQLARLLASALPPGPVIIVDDGSTTAIEPPSALSITSSPGLSSPASAVPAHPRVEVIRHDRPVGPGAARNAGLAKATSPLVAFVDSDIVLPDDWLDALLPHFDDPAVALVAPRVAPLVPDGSALTRYESVRSSLDLGPDPARVAQRTRVAYVPAAVLVVRRDAFDGFHEGMATGEDVDAVWRLVARGWTARYEPKSEVRHDHRTRLVDFLRRRAAYGSSAAPLALRHRHDVVPLAVSGWSAVAWGLVATQTPLGLAGAAAVVGTTTALLPAKLTTLAVPNPVAARLARRGHLGAGRQIASAVMRTWLPIAIPIAIRSKRGRRALFAAAVVPALLEWRERRPPIDALRWTLLRCADDAAYCVGVWQGAAEHRTLAPLVPDLTSWPRTRE